MNTLKLLVEYITSDIVKGICDRLSEVLDPGAFHKILPLILRRWADFVFFWRIDELFWRILYEFDNNLIILVSFLSNGLK